MDTQRISIKEAGQILGMGQDTVRLMMRAGVLPIGVCMKARSGKQYRCYVYKGMLEEFLRMPRKEEETCEPTQAS